jgi:Gpi18-like mannosyltransferase
MIFLIGWLSSLVVLKSKYYSNPQSIIDLFFKWDSVWYYAIVKNGYFYVPGKESSVAFFPLYPSLVKIFSFGYIDPVITGFVVSNVVLFLAMIYLYRLINLDYEDKTISLNSVTSALIFPTSFFFSIFYSESLFLFLSVGCFYYARKNRWFLASLFGYFTALTKPLGVFIFIPLLIEYFAPTSFKDFKLSKIKRNVLYLLLIPAGLLTYMTYLYIEFKQPLAFLDAMTAWGRGFGLALLRLATDSFYDPFYRLIFGGFAALSVLILFYLVYSKVRTSYIVYAFVQLFLIFSSGSPESLPRYVSILFPIYLGFALLSRNKLWDGTLKFFSASFLTLFVILFVNGYWFT